MWLLVVHLVSQDLSVAGKRAGLAGERSGLFMEQIRIIKEMRENDRRNYAGADNADRLIRPRYMVWENVAGAFSSNSGEDFRAVLEETAKVADKDAVIPGLEGGKWSPCGCILGNGWSIAWRLHDAQYYGVPQRRKRICLLADFNGDTAGRILFELQRKTVKSDSEQTILDIGKEPEPEIQSVSEGLSGNTEESRKAGKDVAEDIGSGIEETSRALVLNDQGGSQMSVSDDVSGTLRAEEHGHQPVVYGISAYESNAMKSDNPNSGIYEAETARTLDLNGGSPACNQGGMAVVCLEGNGQRESHKGDGYKESDTMYTLNTVEQHAVCIENHPADSRVKISEDGVCQTLSGRMGTGGGNVPMVMEPQTFSDVASCRSAADGTKGVHSQMMKNPEENFILEPVTASKASFFTRTNDTGIAETLAATDYKDPQVVAYGLDRAAYNQEENAKFSFSVDEEKVGTCVAKGPNAVCKAVDCRNATENEMNGSLQAKASNNLNSNNVVRCESVVRRLTPMECERLQNFPDHWTDIGEWTDSKGKKHKDADSPRYKALGNSIALPFWQWMAGRMMPYLGDKPTMASLFDGIGGFPVVFSRVGCQPVWASEIEEFPIAVTKKRFGDE